ncbi:hypothetical protein BR10RB9215_C10382 [Brucella sp. 10RB9215]|uniref:hypothetical protein n=1 Tax=Brucella sp. 10RB9215 TaxID=1149953 RepID=UPI000909D4C7|nr:hypothetical protein [Brucella sp. 10RB9215]SBW13574.1 hypothetical protein BR10RB9215_C10382 [Brucella sp. 10RB9215]
MLSFNPFDWYWLSEDGRLFSSSSKILIESDDAEYVNWIDSGNNPSRWPTDDSGVQTNRALQEVLAPYGIFFEIGSLKNALKQQVDRAAETERLKYITPGAGQAMTYQQKVDEARAFKAASNPKASDYPILSSEVGITAETIGGVADIVLAAFARWQQIGAMIESVRLGAKRDIDAAEDEAAARAIIEAVVWPSAQVQA